MQVVLTFGTAQYIDGRWFSLSEEAYSSGAVLHPTQEAAEAEDARHHAFMMGHHPSAKARAPYIERKESVSVANRSKP